MTHTYKATFLYGKISAYLTAYYLLPYLSHCPLTSSNNVTFCALHPPSYSKFVIKLKYPILSFAITLTSNIIQTHNRILFAVLQKY